MDDSLVAAGFLPLVRLAMNNRFRTMSSREICVEGMICDIFNFGNYPNQPNQILRKIPIQIFHQKN
ncbi:hypothetical protein ZOSMA_268G00020 [Zostera marina]|uniref:Uncharacterized protein n=1 Tax=Zostera marina TaxID=29655 RepID=A0A0K9PED8_ZOSMR|nr:hypothetical protein ZOSMA_268G00020 [Zostera marina]